MSLSLRNTEFWHNCPMFIPFTINILAYGINLIGYFPYHVAKIYPEEVSHGKYASLFPIPRRLFRNIERILTLHRIIDNKAVYIFESNDEHTEKFRFALMFKDNYCLLSDWDNVVRWDGKPINEKTR